MEPTAYDAIRAGLDVAHFLGLIAVGLYSWISSRRRATNDAIKAVEAQHAADIRLVEAQMQAHGDRILRAEQQIEHLPDGDKIGEVHYRIDQVGQGVKGLEGELKQINHTLHLIQGYLLENKK